MGKDVELKQDDQFEERVIAARAELGRAPVVVEQGAVVAFSSVSVLTILTKPIVQVNEQNE
jgi:hypothetical protein